MKIVCLPAPRNKMSGKQDGVECLQVLSDFRRVYSLIDAIVYSLQLVRRHQAEAEVFVDFLEDKYTWLQEKAAVLYPDAHNQLNRSVHKYLHELEQLLRSAQELLKELTDPFKFFTRAVERFNQLRDEIDKTLGLMEFVLHFAPPEKLDRYGIPQVNVGLDDPIPEKWFDPPPAAEILLETKTSSSSGGRGGEPTATWKTWRVLNEVHSTPELFSDLFSYVDNRPQLILMIESLKTLVPAEDTVLQVTSPYLQTLLSDPHRA